MNRPRRRLADTFLALGVPHVSQGSKGKVEEFQCGPAQFQKLIDAIHMHADPVENDDGNLESQMPGVPGDDNATTTSTQSVRSSEEEGVIGGLREQLDTIEADKVYIQQLETGVETQRSMLEAKDGEISNATKELERQRALIASHEASAKSLEEQLDRQQAATRQARDELAAYQSHVNQLTVRISNIQATMSSVEAASSINEKAAQEKEWTLARQRQDWEKAREMYEKERRSLRKLSALGIKRLGTLITSPFSRLRQR